MRKELQDEKRAAFEAIVAEYEAPLLRYALRLVRNYDSAQDIVQDAFIKLFRKWKEPLVPSPQISSWLYRVCHNRAVDYIRRESRRQSLHKRHAEEQPVSVPPNRGEAFRISEAAARADASMRQLSLREQQLVILKVYEEKSYKEIGEIMGLSVGNVGYILHHAMRKMAKSLKEKHVAQ